MATNGKIYSVRMILTNVRTQWVTYTVPAGKRAVVRQVSVTWGAAAGDFVECDIGPTVVFLAIPQGTARQLVFDVRWTMYAGEHLSYWGVGGQTCGTINGFLFDDPQGREEPALLPAPPEKPPPAYQPGN